MVVLLAVLLTACSSSEDFDEEEKPVQLVVAHLNFSLPQRIVGKKKAHSTRMSDEVVQAAGEEGEFRGIDQIRMFCFNKKPDANSNKIGNVIEMNTKSSNVSEEVTTDDYSLSKEIDVPVGTSYFSFYANAEEEPISNMTEHERRMHYGVVEAVGIDKKTYTGNSSIRFRPVPICTKKDKLGGSSKGEALLNRLNYLMNIRVDNVPAPNDRWETAANLYLNEAYQRMTQLTTLSSYNVQAMLGVILKMINQEAPDNQASKLVEKITKGIKEICDPETEPDMENGVIVLKDTYQGFPEDLHLPAGAARIQWDEEENNFVVPDVQAYGKGLNVMSVNDYVYPMNLQYQVLSDIVASDQLVINEVNEEGEIVPPESAKYDTWSDVLNEGYGLDADKAVQPTTRSVAMVQQVEYAVGSLALRARITPGTIYDAKGKPVDVSNGFTLKGYIVGGQREVDYDFQPVEDSPLYAIYDTDLNKKEGEARVYVKQRIFPDPADDLFDYILGLSTEKGQNIQLAMELVNNCPDFQGADGVIAHGATFYLVANLELDPNSSTDIRQIFSKANSTQVNLTIVSGWPDNNGDGIPDPDPDEHGNPQPVNGLATATYGMPSLEIPHPTVGLSVDLSWGEGLWFDEVEL